MDRTDIFNTPLLADRGAAKKAKEEVLKLATEYRRTRDNGSTKENTAMKIWDVYERSQANWNRFANIVAVAACTKEVAAWYVSYYRCRADAMSRISLYRSKYEDPDGYDRKWIVPKLRECISSEAIAFDNAAEEERKSRTALIAFEKCLQYIEQRIRALRLPDPDQRIECKEHERHEVQAALAYSVAFEKWSHLQILLSNNVIVDQYFNLQACIDYVQQKIRTHNEEIGRMANKQSSLPEKKAGSSKRRTRRERTCEIQTSFETLSDCLERLEKVKTNLGADYNQRRQTLDKQVDSLKGHLGAELAKVTPETIILGIKLKRPKDMFTLPARTLFPDDADSRQRAMATIPADEWEQHLRDTVPRPPEYGGTWPVRSLFASPGPPTSRAPSSAGQSRGSRTSSPIPGAARPSPNSHTLSPAPGPARLRRTSSRTLGPPKPAPDRR